MTTIQQPVANGRFLFADGLRGLAALWVVLFHMEEGKHIPFILQALPDWLDRVLFSYGHLGVPIFLVLSGYVMAWTARKTYMHYKSAALFLMRRLSRLSPPYYFSLMFAILFLALKAFQIKNTGILPSISSIVAHMFYVEALFDFKYINSVYWTLWIEIQFYLFFVVVLLLIDCVQTRKTIFPDKRYDVFFALGIVSLLWPAHVLTHAFWPMGFAQFWYCFSAGVMVSWAMAYPSPRRDYLSLGFLGLVLLIGCLRQDLFVMITGITGLLLFVAGKYHYMDKWLSWSWIQFLGMISYSLYLLHNPLTGATANILRKVFSPGLLTDIVVFISTLSISIVVAWVAYKLIELPSIRLSHRFKS